MCGICAIVAMAGVHSKYGEMYSERKTTTSAMKKTTGTTRSKRQREAAGSDYKLTCGHNYVQR